MMPAFKPIAYPDNLMRKRWDKNKSMLAKAAGKTGIGEDADKAQAVFGKIDWTQFDIVKLTPTESSPEALAKVEDIKKGVTAEWNRSVKPVMDALKKLENTATAASAKLAKNKLLKDDVKLADDFAKQADIFSGSLLLNSVFFDAVAKEWKTSHDGIVKNLAIQREIATKTKEYLMALLAGLSKVQAFDNVNDPNYIDNVSALWNSEVKQQGRSVSNNLKSNASLAKKFLKTWTTKFQGFDWGAIGLSNQSDPAKLRAELLKFIGEVKRESVELAKDLK